MTTIKEQQIIILELQKQLTNAQATLRSMQIDEQIAKISAPQQPQN